MRKSTLLLFFLFIITFSFSQTDTSYFSADTTKSGKKIKNSNLAIALSAVVPGTGQIYNGKFWKIPIIYTGFAASFYFVRINNWEYQTYRHDIQIVTDPLITGRTVSDIYDPDILATNYNLSRRKRDLAFLGGVAVWALNIIDAYIDAELSDFDVSEDLSIKFYPSIKYITPNNPSLCINFQYQFK